MAFIDLGPHILVHTHHDVAAGPYHRLSRGIIDVYEFFSSPAQVARPIAARRAIDYVVFCSRAATPRFAGGLAPDALWNVLTRAEVPDWLEPVPETSQPLQIYRVLR
jgi:hypothetical protein